MKTARSGRHGPPLLAALLFYAFAMAQTIPESAVTRPGSRTDLVPCVVYLHAAAIWNVLAGSGFIVVHEGHHYLVTARHVIRDTAGLERHATLRGPSGQPVDFKVSDLAIDPNARWTEHASEDVAAIAIQAAPLRPLGVRAISAIDVRRIKYERLDGDPSILVLGFPLGIGVTTFSPIGRWTLLVSDEIEYRGAKYLILNDPSVDGFSGAPAFDLGETPLGGGSFGYGPFACNGVVSATLFDKTGGKFAAVVPPQFVLEVIRTEAALRNRPERESQRLGPMFEGKEAKP